MNEILNVAGKEIVRREIMELCREAEPYGAGTPVLKAALRKTGHDLTDQEADAAGGLSGGQRAGA